MMASVTGIEFAVAGAHAIEFVQAGIGPTGSAIALATLRSVTGAFFAISGYHKLFNKGRHETLVATLKADGVPFLRFNQWFVPAVEFFAGIALLFGLATPLAAMFLLGICIVATCVDGVKRIGDTLDIADWIDSLLYLPEVILMFILGALIVSGSGPFSADAFIFG